MARIFALSDIHVDQIENLQWVEKLSFKKYQDDVLILAGDVTDKIPLLKSTLLLLTKKFQRVFFVPGNHDLWIREANSLEDSCIKFERILAICKQLRVETSPALVDTCDGKRVWIVPMFSWYSTPEEDKEDSLYIIDPWVPNDRQSTNLWMDNRYCVWPDDLYPETPAQYFSSLNEERCSGLYDEPVISFSHFVPRKEMIKAFSSIKQIEKTLGPDAGCLKEFTYISGCYISLGSQKSR